MEVCLKYEENWPIWYSVLDFYRIRSFMELCKIVILIGLDVFINKFIIQVNINLLLIINIYIIKILKILNNFIFLDFQCYAFLLIAMKHLFFLFIYFFQKYKY